MTSLTREGFQLAFQISPIILTGGIAAAVPGGMLPIVALTEAASLTLGLLSGSADLALDDFFAQWKPAPGATLVNAELGKYPFANQQVAANALITDTLNVSMLMNCSPRSTGAMTSRFLTMTALKQVLAAHSNAGGLYTVITPSYPYTNCALLMVRDVTQGNSKHVQTDWQFDFEQPLITYNAASEVYSSLLAKLDGGTELTSTSWSGVSTTIGSALSGAATSIVSTASNLLGAAVSAGQSVVSSVSSAL